MAYGHLNSQLLTFDHRADGWTVDDDGEHVYVCRHGIRKARFRKSDCPDCLRHLISVEIERQMGIMG